MPSGKNRSLSGQSHKSRENKPCREGNHCQSYNGNIGSLRVWYRNWWPKSYIDLFLAPQICLGLETWKKVR